MKIILSGGGTLGPVVPLLAVVEMYKSVHPEAEFVWVGTKNGPEKEVVEAAGLTFIPVGGGKWRRYLSFWNLIDLIRIVMAWFHSLVILWEQKPVLLISAGGFISVPLHYAAAFLGIPTWVHQQDLKVGLANRLMFPVARKVTTALQENLALLPKRKSEWLGNPSRDLSGASIEEARQFFGIPDGVKVIFALGGGTGSNTINGLVAAALPNWPNDYHVIHLIGKERSHELSERTAGVFQNYHIYEFFTTEMKLAYVLADVVIARAGFGTITEVAALSKPTILVPMPKTHQEQNAAWFSERHGVMVLDEQVDSGLKLAQDVKFLLQNPSEAQALGNRLHALLPRAEAARVVGIIDGIVGK